MLIFSQAISLQKEFNELLQSSGDFAYDNQRLLTRKDGFLNGITQTNDLIASLDSLLFVSVNEVKQKLYAFTKGMRKSVDSLILVRYYANEFLGVSNNDYLDYLKSKSKLALDETRDELKKVDESLSAALSLYKDIMDSQAAGVCIAKSACPEHSTLSQDKNCVCNDGYAQTKNGISCELILNQNDSQSQGSINWVKNKRLLKVKWIMSDPTLDNIVSYEYIISPEILSNLELEKSKFTRKTSKASVNFPISRYKKDKDYYFYVRGLDDEEFSTQFISKTIRF